MLIQFMTDSIFP